MNRLHTSRGGPRPARGSVARPIGVGIVALAAVAAVLAARGTGSDSAAPAAESVAHVHGLGVDPDDGVLRVATHNGLYRMPDDGTPERVGAEQHDFMGFTVDGPGRLLASGHPSPGTPAFRELDRPLFGLIESTDGGRTWDPVSLSGEVDFHALEAVHGNVYGADSTGSRFLVSTDGGSTWEERSTISIVDLAVDPADEDHIVASTAEGLAESTDGGRTWRPLDGPRVAFMDWDDERGLWGLDGQGAVHRFEDGRWRVVEELGGSPQALLVHDGGVAAAVDDGSTVIYTTDDGQDWTVRYRDDTAP